MGASIETEEISIKLKHIQEFIHHADGILLSVYDDNDTKDKMRKRVTQLIESSFVLEDVLDEYMMICAQQESRLPGCPSSEFVDFIKNIIRRCQIKRMHEDLNSQFGEMEKEISKKDGGQIQSTFEENQYMHRADVPVGLDRQINKLIGWLVKGRSHFTGIFVIGMVGSGKTTLAKEIFHDKRILHHFKYRVWITVPQPYNREVLLRDMLCQLYKQSGHSTQSVFAMSSFSLFNEFRRCLEQKRYVFFFDDVWDIQIWNDIEMDLPENNNGSRVFFTTRTRDVFHQSRRFMLSKLHEMSCLSDEKSMELFCMKAFQSDYKGYCPENLKQVSYEIVSKCMGVPLAIVTVGSLLSRKHKNVIEWKRFSQNLSLELEQNSRFLHILNISYNELPSHLKPCLLYFAIYPEDYVVKSKRLIRQWIAEGFVTEESGFTLEEVAEGYLTELIHTSFVQVHSISQDGKFIFCYVHGIIHGMIQRKTKHLRFCKFIAERNQHLPVGIIRRLSIANTSNEYLMESNEGSHVRSLLFFTEEELPENLVKRIPTKYKLLKVLDFENTRSLDVPENVGDLFHLKYLSFRNTELQSLPKSIGKLQNLETLDIRQTTVHEIPKEISKLRKMRHLLGNTMSLSNLKREIGYMESLQTLGEVKIDEGYGMELIEELGKLSQLRKLSLSGVREEHGIALCSSINEMQHLEKLYIETKYEKEHLDLSMVSCPSLLRKLRLQAKLNKLPDWIPNLEILVELSLLYSQLTEDPLESLQNLPNLLVLNLSAYSYEGHCFHFQGGFKNLKELGLRHLSNLKSIIIEQGALDSLKELTLMNIPNLMTAPCGIDYLKNLDVLSTHFMPAEFEESIAPLAKRIKENM